MKIYNEKSKFHIFDQNICKVTEKYGLNIYFYDIKKFKACKFSFNKIQIPGEMYFVINVCVFGYFVN